MNISRKRIYEIIEVAKAGDRVSDIYDTAMLIAIIVSIIPLATKNHYQLFLVTDAITTAMFIIDYFLRWATADLKQKNGLKSFAKYPITPWAVVDLLSILPSLTVLNSGFKLLRLFRVARTLRVLRAMRVVRVAKAMRYSNSLAIIVNVIRRSKEALYAVATLAVGYVLVSALVIFNVEPDSFNNFFEAIYWATISLTTVGYGDIYAVSTIGRIVTMVSSIFGIAIVALPAGIITAGYLDELQKDKTD